MKQALLMTLRHRKTKRMRFLPSFVETLLEFVLAVEVILTNFARVQG
jgi:hypothetical protein